MSRLKYIALDGKYCSGEVDIIPLNDLLWIQFLPMTSTGTPTYYKIRGDKQRYILLSNDEAVRVKEILLQVEL